MGQPFPAAHTDVRELLYDETRVDALSTDDAEERKDLRAFVESRVPYFASDHMNPEDRGAALHL